MTKTVKIKRVEKKRGGRPRVMTPRVIADLVKALKAGAHPGLACDYAGIHRDTFYHWLKTGQTEKDAAVKENREYVTDLISYVEFSDKITKARADFEMRHVLIINNQALKNASLSQWSLEKKNHSEWGRRETVEQNITAGDGNTTIIIERTPNKK